MASAESIIQAVCKDFMPGINERERRQLAGVMAKAFGYGGTMLVSKYSNMSRNTIYKGIEELDNPGSPDELSKGGVRRTGGGRIRVAEVTVQSCEKV